ncbi:hypothetical protein [Leptospira yasudae]|uniref:Uncharacterized protein n=1 Tax=Leptospira yasudae TaxID=2202201 RepID=A0A6N4R0R2_9LEPT|nr:hypothetical protein [Leptospira yasudae]TGL80878.1 hypothetical protein EHQ72_06620 [Leptospira yasudae]TGL81678.1 hypothetical protein EHQ77_06270 [Leptospira yasudae]TGL88054.1 hypothetical protein EHQ83_03630 [Leptospira yasudae]
MTFHSATNITIDRIYQGDIFEKVSFIESYVEIDGQFELNVLEFPYILILTQDCDLEQNKNERLKNLDKNDKFLISILAAPLYIAEHIFDGNHLTEIKIKTEKHSSDSKKKIKQNQNQRFHYIELDKVFNLPPLVIDFKHYFSITLNSLEKQMENKICAIEPIYRESISQRFAHYLSRIGLPNTDIVDKESTFA